MDVDNAFLQGTLYEEVFIAQPHGFVDSNFLSHVCRLLRKAIYGLKKSPQACIKNSTLFYNPIVFLIIKLTTPYFYHKDAIKLYFLIYVDDLIIIGNCDSIAHALFISEINNPTRMPITKQARMPK